MLFSDYQNSVKSSPKSRKWHFRESKFKNFLGPSALAFSPPPQSKRASYTALKTKTLTRSHSCMHGLIGLLSRLCEDIFKKTIHSNEIKENYTTQNHKRLHVQILLPIPNLQYRGMVQIQPCDKCTSSNHTYQLL